MTKKELTYQSKLRNKLLKMFPGSIVTYNDPNRIQGIPDLVIFYNNKWATLEVKINSKANVQPNQEWYVKKMDNMSFSRFIYPENEEEVLNELRQALQSPE